MKTIVKVCKDIIGMQRYEAEQLAIDNGYIFRVVNIDGKPLIITHDYRINRINVHLLNGKVISTTTG